MKVTEVPVSDLINTSTTLRQQVICLQKTKQLMRAKLEEMEERSCRNNLRLVGVPEKAESPSADGFVEHFILDVLKPRAYQNSSL
ncbi:hypothetical protein NDU88_000229 [Pleurodeles waltl]|uniref:Uncharacterized protein n=1 Tax=Pleurodeles waltl TaxID=8319 RepID=A0AAV7LU21_PLEWA|nr:hypothetical protein NDU88_000227 [Pleurodeles waltl]KAJ1095058.1 hypothetical protein NDU88_000229 [Pleurodeles waltl]